MAAPPAKRSKITRGEDDYMPGNITEIELHNFMTFDHVKCRPGSRLNLVIGPNGSGKSSLVCAIALGLGGEPQLLGRATSVGAYVKRGEESGFVKITLRGVSKDEHICITRKIDTRNKSEWLFNGKPVPKKEIAEVTNRFNIQVGNLTQFLPQDRVSEFAKLSPVQLLEETEKAVGDPQLPIRHRALVEKSKELKIIERTVETNEKTLDQHKAHIAEQQREVERVRQREVLLDKAKNMEKKLPWLQYDMKKSEYIEVKENEKEAKKKLEEATKLLDMFNEPIEKAKIEKAKVDTIFKKVEKRINNHASKRAAVVEKAEELEVLVQGKYKEMENLKREEESCQQKILQAKEELADAKKDLENLPRYEAPKHELERLGAQIVELELSHSNKRNLKSDKEKLLMQKQGALRQCMERLNDMENRSTKILQALKRSGADRIADAYNWVQEHRHEFNKEVYGPVLLEVNVSDKHHANYLEDHISSYIWKSFITQDSHDRDLLVNSLRSFDVPVLNYVGSGRRHEPFHISTQMRELGISSRLDQVFEAPPAVKEVLTSQFGLDRSYIGSRETDLRADEVQNLGIFDCWTPDNHYRWSKSRYGGHISASVETVSQSRLLLCGVDSREIESLRAKKMELEESVTSLEQSVKMLQSEQRKIEDEEAELRKQQEEMIRKSQFEKRKRTEMERSIDQKRRRLEALEKRDDLDTVLAKLVDQANECNTERFNCAIALKNLLVEEVSQRQILAEKQMSSIELDAKVRELEVNLKQHEKSAFNASLHLEECKKEVQNLRQQLLDAKRYAESIAEMTPELEKEFLQMPTTIEELQAAIQDCKSEANSIFCLNRNVLEEYENRLQQIQTLSTKVEADKEKLRRFKDDIEKLKESWLPVLRNLVAQINETFSRNFQEMAVAGEVSLDEHEFNFDQFGILIKVKFRQAGELQVLSAHHQSGGERSVSTILYLVSLQDLTHCPFRVVDEINQGMDQINERKMFQQLVRAASQLNTPQCFLLTPKLLPDLQYSEACSILNIMNGPWVDQPSKAWSGGECWRTVTGLVGEMRS